MSCQMVTFTMRSLRSSIPTSNSDRSFNPNLSGSRWTGSLLFGYHEQMKDYLEIVEAFKSGRVTGHEDEPTPKHIETVISHVFLFNDVVYKLYKRENEIFNKNFRDLNNEEVRTHFIKEDYFWNNYFNSDVYKSLVKVRLSNNLIIIDEDQETDGDWVIKMARIDADQTLTNVLRKNPIPTDKLKSLGHDMTKLIAEFPHTPKAENNFYENFVSRIIDVREWLLLADEKDVPKEVTEKIDSALKSYLEKNKERFESFPISDLVIAPDNHSDNVLFIDSVHSFIDLYPPKASWLLSEPFMNICRLSTCVAVLSDEESANAVIDGYNEYYDSDSNDESLKTFYQIYSAAIQGAYVFMLANGDQKLRDEAQRYFDFIEKWISRIY